MGLFSRKSTNPAPQSAPVAPSAQGQTRFPPAEDFDPSQASEEHRETIGTIMNTLTPIFRSDDSEELKQWIPTITGLCRQLTSEDPRLIRFVQDLHGMASRAALADWASGDNVRPLSDQGWSHLIAALEATYPDANLVRDE